RARPRTRDAARWPRHLPALAAPLPGESWRAASSPPALLAFTPVALVDLFAPLTSVGRLPLWRPIAVPSSPLGRGRGVVPDGDPENRSRNVYRLDRPPRTVPVWSDVPSSVREGPVLV